jgi:predicted ATPase
MLTEENAVHVAQVCQQLDGIPLALELAAARVKVLGVAQIASRLDDSFRVLGVGSRTAQPRHQTLRAAIDWSYELLSVPERLLFRRLCIFNGGWTIEAAEKVCADEQLSEWDVLDFLSLLVTKSLVAVVQNDRGVNRYHFLETVRQYAREKLVQSGELERVQSNHFNFFLLTAEQNEAELRGGRPLKAFIWLAVEHSNLLTAQEWASSGDPPHNPAGLARLSALIHQDFHGWGTHMLNVKAASNKR